MRNIPTAKILGKDLENQLTTIFEKNPEANFFFDETPVEGSSGISMEFLKHFSRNIPLLWIACNATSTKKTLKDRLEAGKIKYILVIIYYLPGTN